MESYTGSFLRKKPENCTEFVIFYKNLVLLGDIFTFLPLYIGKRILYNNPANPYKFLLTSRIFIIGGISYVC
jgi:hypothetical protein